MPVPLPKTIPEGVEECWTVVEEPYSTNGLLERVLVTQDRRSPFRFWEEASVWPAPDGRVAVWKRKSRQIAGVSYPTGYMLGWLYEKDGQPMIDGIYEVFGLGVGRMPTILAFFREMADVLREEVAPGASRHGYARQFDEEWEAAQEERRRHKEQTQGLTGKDFRRNAEDMVGQMLESLPPEAAGRIVQAEQFVEGLAQTPLFSIYIRVAPRKGVKISDK